MARWGVKITGCPSKGAELGSQHPCQAAYNCAKLHSQRTQHLGLLRHLHSPAFRHTPTFNKNKVIHVPLQSSLEMNENSTLCVCARVCVCSHVQKMEVAGAPLRNPPACCDGWEH